MLKEFSKIIGDLDIGKGIFNWEEQKIDQVLLAIAKSVDYLEKEKIVFITHLIRYNWWQSFCEIAEERSASGIIIVDHHPQEWPCPSGCVVVAVQSCVMNNLDQMMCRGNLPPIQTHRKTDQLPYSFFMPVRSADQGRTLIQRHLSILGIADKALMSTPEISADSLLLDHRDPWSVNLELCSAQTGTTFDHGEFSLEKKFNLGGANIDHIIPSLQKCRFAVAMDNNPNWMDTCAFMTEKMLWSFWAGVPVVWLCNSKKRALLESWGFRDSADGFERLINPVENPIMGWISEIAALERLVTSSVSQRWQDAQGERVYNNYQKIQTLNNLLHEQQWDEWQKIKNII